MTCSVLLLFENQPSWVSAQLLQSPTPQSPTQLPTPVITLDNAASVHQIGQFGRGHVLERFAYWSNRPFASAWSRDGKWLALATLSGVWIYDATALDKTPRLLTGNDSRPGLYYTPEGSYSDIGVNDEPSRSVVFTPNSRILAVSTVGGQDGDPQYFRHLWDVVTGKELNISASGIPIVDAWFSLDGQEVVTTDTGFHLRLWNLQTDSLIRLYDYQLKDGQTRLAFDGKGNFYAIGDFNAPQFHLWDVAANQEIVLPEPYRDRVINNLQFSPDGRLWAVSMSGGVHIWDTQAQRELYSLRTPQAVFSPNSSLIAVLSPHPSIINAFTSQTVTLLDLMPNTSVAYLSFTPDGGTVYGSVRDSSGKEQGTALWDVTTGHQRVFISDEAPGFFGDMDFSPDGHRFLTTVTNQDAYLWNADTGQSQPWPEHSTFIFHLVFSPDSQMLIAETWYEIGLLIDVKTMQLREILTGDGFSFSADSRQLYYHNSATSTFYTRDLTTGAVQSRPSPTGAYLYRVVFSPDNSLFAAVQQNQITVWRVSDYTLVASITINNGVFNPEFSASNRYLDFYITSDESRHYRWDTVTGKLTTLDGPITLRTLDNKVIIQAIDGQLAPDTADYGGFLQLNAVTDAGTSRKTLLHAVDDLQGANVVALSPDGTRIVTGGYDGIIRFWGVQ